MTISSHHHKIIMELVEVDAQIAKLKEPRRTLVKKLSRLMECGKVYRFLVSANQFCEVTKVGDDHIEINFKELTEVA